MLTPPVCLRRPVGHSFLSDLLRQKRHERLCLLPRRRRQNPALIDQGQFNDILNNTYGPRPQHLGTGLLFTLTLGRELGALPVLRFTIRNAMRRAHGRDFTQPGGCAFINGCCCRYTRQVLIHQICHQHRLRFVILHLYILSLEQNFVAKSMP